MRRRVQEDTMVRLGLSVVAAFVLALPAEAEETKPSPPPYPLFQIKPHSFSPTDERQKSVEFQLKVRQKDFFERERGSFSEREAVQFITPVDRIPKANKTKVLFGVVVRF